MRTCQQIFKATTGRKPFGLALPVGIFNKMAGPEMVEMWLWLAAYLVGNQVEKLIAEVDLAREGCPDLHSVADWLKLTRNEHVA